MSDFLLSLTASLKRDEGLELTAYWDPIGECWTVGYGHNLKVPITMDAATKILEDDIHVAMLELDRTKPFWRMLPHEARVVVANMQFNLGTGRLAGFKKMWAALERGDYQAAAVEMRDSLWATQVKSRADRLCKLMASAQEITEV